MSTPSAPRERLTGPLEETTRLYYVLVGVAGLVVLGMLYSFVTVLTEGHSVTELNNWGTDGGVPWGLDVGAFSWWAAMGVGAISLSAIVRIFRLEGYEPYARIGELLTPLAFAVSFLHIVFDIGQPFKVFNTLIYLPLQSPIAWDVILLGGLGALSAVYLVVALRSDLHVLRHGGHLPSALSPVYDALLIGYRADSGRDGRGILWWLAAAVLVFIPVVGAGLVPFVWSSFGQGLNWFGAIQGPTFLAQSMTAGAAAVLLVAALLRYAYGLEDVFTDRSMQTLGVATAAVAFTYLVGVLYEIQTGTFAADLADPNVGALIFEGPLGVLLWLALAAITVPIVYLIVQRVLGRFSLVGTVLFAGLLLVGILHQETWLIVGGLMYPDLMYPTGEYAPSIYEWLNLMGTTGLVALGLLVFAKTLPVVPVGAGNEVDSGR